ncbi:MAG: hypothetical protein AB7O96_04585 [Pseudobdellovibrionaceae bacterium]
MKKSLKLAIAALTLVVFGSFAFAVDSDAQLRQYLNSLFKAAKSTPASTLDFVSDDPLSSKPPSLYVTLRNIREFNMSPNLSLEKQVKEPQLLFQDTSRGNKGSTAFWRNDAFAADFFVRQFTAWNQAKSADPKILMNKLFKQPWFEWKENGSFVYQASGAEVRILDHLRNTNSGSSLVVYRGTTDYESNVFEFSKMLKEKQPLPVDWRETLDADLKKLIDHAQKEVKTYAQLFKEGFVERREADEKLSRLEKIKGRAQKIKEAMDKAQDEQMTAWFLSAAIKDLMNQGSFRGLFTTPSLERAKLFSKGQVIKFEFTWNQLEKFLVTKNLYIGFENIGNNAQAELAFVSLSENADIGNFLSTVQDAYRSSTAVEPGQLFN